MYGPVGRSSYFQAARSSFFSLALKARGSELTALHAPLPSPLRTSSASHLRCPCRRGTDGRSHPKSSHRLYRRPQPGETLERRPVHSFRRLRALSPPAHRHEPARLHSVPHSSAHGAVAQHHRHPPHHPRDGNLPPPPESSNL